MDQRDSELLEQPQLDYNKTQPVSLENYEFQQD